MMKDFKFKTDVTIAHSGYNLDYKSKVLTIGSCFSDHLGAFLEKHRFNVLSNPFGTIYNIQSIADLILSVLGRKSINDDWFVSRDNIFLHYAYHSKINNDTKDGLAEKIEELNQEVFKWLMDLNLLVITLGTSWVYTKEEKVVSNCHRQDASLFEKVLLEPDQQIMVLTKLLEDLKEINPGLKTVLTVSPVRHLKDGLADNNLSKSVLRWVAGEVERRIEGVYYFPSYEIIIDELRDYRYYERDLIHPNSVAVDYILQHFSNSFFDKSTLNIMSRWEKWLTSFSHKPLNAKGKAYREFLENLKSELSLFDPYFDTQSVLNKINSRLERTY